jgi:hypothetical protein
LLSSSAGSVLLTSEARTGEAIATGAANNNKLAKQHNAGLAWNEAHADRDRASKRRITAQLSH